ncbi:MAG: DUF5020 family protein [Bacteroidales bacterium]|nr:DUF5020 family protein [Bacteroidales bacterium]
MKKSFILVALATLAFAFTAKAQTNFQTFYDFGRKHFTTTMEGFHVDKWGNTFFFIDYDYNNRDANGKVISPNNTYFEIARCLNFWQDSALAPISLQVEYNGGFGTWGDLSGVPGVGYGAFPVNSAFLVGLDWFLHTKDFSSTLNFKLLYKQFVGLPSKVPFQFTTVWGSQDVFGIKGFRFSGFLDVWCEYEHVVVLSEPQLWFGFGDHFNIGGEVEFSYNFAGMEGFNVMPCLGWKWVF